MDFDAFCSELEHVSINHVIVFIFAIKFKQTRRACWVVDEEKLNRNVNLGFHDSICLVSVEKLSYSFELLHETLNIKA